VVFFDPMIPDELADLVEGLDVVGPGDADLARAEAVVCGVTRRYDATVFAQAPRLRVVARSGIGYDNVDVADAARFGIVVANAPDAPSVSTAEHAIALMLTITKELPALHARARRGERGTPATALELDGAVLGLVGTGRIGRRVAVAGLALGMDVLAHDPFVTGPPVGVTMTDLDSVLTRADVVSLHAPGGAETHHLIDASTLARMKRGVNLVNCARGSLVDQVALLHALESGHVAGAGLDVTEPEPLPAGHPLLEHPNVVVTPHIASSTRAGRRRLYAHAIANALAVLRGEPCASVIPPPT
jgi:D-3-phosphoglycerate dehydrogenase / 2-oxoglutarate reductase